MTDHPLRSTQADAACAARCASRRCCLTARSASAIAASAGAGPRVRFWPSNAAALRWRTRRNSASTARRNGPSAASARRAARRCSIASCKADFAAVSLEALDDRAGFAFTGQVFIDEKPAYYDFANATKTMTGAEVFAAFGRLARKQRVVTDTCRAQFHHQFRAAASGGAWRAAPRAGARRRGRRAGRSAYRPAASRHREADRVQDLSPGDPLFRPARLRRADEPGARLLPRGREAARASRCRGAPSSSACSIARSAGSCRTCSTSPRRRWTSAR